MLTFIAFLVFIVFVAFIALKSPIAIGTYFLKLSLIGCTLPTVGWRINPRLSPLREIPVHPGTHLHSGDPEHLLADGT